MIHPTTAFAPFEIRKKLTFPGFKILFLFPYIFWEKNNKKHKKESKAT